MSDLAGLPNCPFCGNRVSPTDKKVWKRVKGWVGGPRKDSMRLREDTGEYAHDACVKGVQEGHPPDQARLFEE